MVPAKDVCWPYLWPSQQSWGWILSFITTLSADEKEWGTEKLGSQAQGNPVGESRYGAQPTWLWRLELLLAMGSLLSEVVPLYMQRSRPRRTDLQDAYFSRASGRPVQIVAMSQHPSSGGPGLSYLLCPCLVVVSLWHQTGIKQRDEEMGFYFFFP